MKNELEKDELALGNRVMSRSFVVLPLYSTKAGQKYIPERSGLNQWLASGRARRFGECYFPVPRDVHRRVEGFFPPQGEIFKLLLPGGHQSRAKLCQAGAKALMTSPNHHLGIWLYKLIDPEPSIQIRRMASLSPFVYADLERLGFDSVMVSREGEDYVLSAFDLGGYESWINAPLKKSSRD